MDDLEEHHKFEKNKKIKNIYVILIIIIYNPLIILFLKMKN
jgi:hypothetical protein